MSCFLDFRLNFILVWERENFYFWIISHLVDEKSFLSFRHSPVFTGAGSAEAGIQTYLDKSLSYFRFPTSAGMTFCKTGINIYN